MDKDDTQQSSEDKLALVMADAVLAAQLPEMALPADTSTEAAAAGVDSVPDAPLSPDEAQSVPELTPVEHPEPVAAPKADDFEDASRPLKRRRGGRRVSNPNMSVEERRRQRVLKNRESAMRSLAKKAEYAARLADTQKLVFKEQLDKQSELRKLADSAIELRNELATMDSPSASELLASISACVVRCNALMTPIPGDELLQAPPPHLAPHPATVPAHALSTANQISNSHHPSPLQVTTSAQLVTSMQLATSAQLGSSASLATSAQIAASAQLSAAHIAASAHLSKSAQLPISSQIPTSAQGPTAAQLSVPVQSSIPAQSTGVSETVAPQ